WVGRGVYRFLATGWFVARGSLRSAHGSQAANVGKVKIRPPRSVAAGRLSHRAHRLDSLQAQSGASLRARLLPVKPSVGVLRPGLAPPVEPGHDTVTVVVERQGRRHREGR